MKVIFIFNFFGLAAPFLPGSNAIIKRMPRSPAKTPKKEAMNAKAIEVKAGDKIALVGNPNVGKSLIFNYLTGQYAVVSNYPGTTVDFTSGKMLLGSGGYCEVIDTPGTNSLLPKSEDEEVTRNVLCENGIGFVLQVADYKNVKRALHITLELIELGLPMALDLNIEDEALERGITVDKVKLSEMLGGIGVTSTSATLVSGLSELKSSLASFRTGSLAAAYPAEAERLCSELSAAMPVDFRFKRAVALMLACGDRSAAGIFKGDHLKKIEEILARRSFDEIAEIAISIFNAREKAVESIAARVFAQTAAGSAGMTLRHRLGLMMTGFWLGPVTLVATVYLLYLFVGVFGAGYCVDFLQNDIFGKFTNGILSGGYVNRFFVWAVEKIAGGHNFLFRMLVGEFGLLTMGLTYAIAIVLPIMVSFFLAFSFLEDSGYLPRLTVLSDRIFKNIGLNGKAILPMVLGFGCGTMAVLSTRILDSKKERLIATIILALGIPCSAQLGVMMGLCSKIAGHGAILVFLAVFLQVLIVGKLSHYLLPGDASEFVMELPPIRFPQLKNIAQKTFNRTKWFLSEAVPLFLIGTFALFIFSESGMLKNFEVWFSPVIEGMLGLPREATFAFLIGFLRRDYGAAGLYSLAEKGLLDPVQIMVSLVVITLFVPCVACFFMMAKERGLKKAALIALFITPYAVLIGYLFRIFLSVLPFNFAR